jgi:hypothetical protein
MPNLETVNNNNPLNCAELFNNGLIVRLEQRHVLSLNDLLDLFATIKTAGRPGGA